MKGQSATLPPLQQNEAEFIQKTISQFNFNEA